MKSLLSILITIILTGAYINTYSQRQMQYMTVEKRFNYADVDGSPYVTEGWNEGTVVFTNNAKLDKALIKFNAYENVLEVKWQDTDYVSKLDNIVNFNYKDPATDKVLSFKVVKIKNDICGFQLLSEGKNVFGIVSVIKRVRGTGSTLESVNNKDKFKMHKTPYMLKNNEYIEFMLNKKSVLELMSDQADKIEAYMKEQKLNPKNENDLKLICDYYNTL